MPEYHLLRHIQHHPDVRRMLTQVFPQVRYGEINLPVPSVLDDLGFDEPHTVDAGILHVLAHAFRDHGCR